MLMLPARASLLKGRIVISFPNEREGGDFKIRLRNRAKRHPLYHTPITISPLVTGRSTTGMPIPINTLGRWIFGVPGYMGNARFDGFKKPPIVELPIEAPQEAIKLFLELGGEIDE